MDDLQKLAAHFDEILALEKEESLTVLGGYIIGAILEQPHELYENNVLVQNIDDCASNLETENGTPEQLQKDWDALKVYVKALKDSL
jgi:outer membrane murein-binding lipoprotein Lpp